MSRCELINAIIPRLSSCDSATKRMAVAQDLAKLSIATLEILNRHLLYTQLGADM